MGAFTHKKTPGNGSRELLLEKHFINYGFIN
jgi:hypothetical protein